MMDDFVAAQSLPKNQFSVFLSDGGSSEITFGGYKEEQKASDIMWVPVTYQSYWEIAINDIAFNNSPQGLCKDCKVAVDTGTSMLAGPSDVIGALSESLDLKSDCSNMHSMPLLGFQIKDQVLNLKPEDYIDQSDGNCQLSLMELDVPPPKGPIFVFGDPFLRRFLTIYDKDGPSVGFAVARQEDGTDTSVLMGTVDRNGGGMRKHRHEEDETVSAVSTSAATKSEDTREATTEEESSHFDWSAFEKKDDKPDVVEETKKAEDVESAAETFDSFKADFEKSLQGGEFLQKTKKTNLISISLQRKKKDTRKAAKKEV